jgi:hypothetical protein
MPLKIVETALASKQGQKSGVRKGTVLTDVQAVEIYRCKLGILAAAGDGEVKMRGQSAAVASKFNISFKTVKDIWHHKTWKHATYHLWPNAGMNGCVKGKGSGAGGDISKVHCNLCFKMLSICTHTVHYVCRCDLKKLNAFETKKYDVPVCCFAAACGQPPFTPRSTEGVSRFQTSWTTIDQDHPSEEGMLHLLLRDLSSAQSSFRNAADSITIVLQALNSSWLRMCRISAIIDSGSTTGRDRSIPPRLALLVKASESSVANFLIQKTLGCKKGTGVSEPVVWLEQFVRATRGDLEFTTASALLVAMD